MAGTDVQIGRREKNIQLTIPNGEITSPALLIPEGLKPAGMAVRFPSDWDGGALTPQVRSHVEDDVWSDMFDQNGTAITVVAGADAAGANKWIAVNADIFAFVGPFRFSVATAVGADRILEVHVKG